MINKEKVINEGSCRAAGAVSGILLAGANIFPVLAPVQIFALIPVFYICAKREYGFSKVFNAAIYMGLFYTIPQMIALRLPIPITIVLLLHLVIIMLCMVLGSSFLLRRNILLGPIAAGALFAVFDWINFKAVPLWGTAQAFARPWSFYPAFIQFSAITGITGIVLILAAIQGFFVNALICPQRNKKLIFALIKTVFVFAGINIIILSEKPAAQIKVAAIGWSTKEFKDVEYAQTDKGFEELFVIPVTKAAEQGAKLVVSPEMGFYINEYDRQEWMDRFKRIAAENNVYLAIGYFDPSKKLNQLIYITPTGGELPEYSKTYLIPIMDNYEKGDGTLRITDINGISVGGMICQDDNFTKLSREYGRKKVSLVAVPTMDWKQVKCTHLQNSIHRAIESRYAVVRATMNGISAIIAPNGKILAKYDHLKNGAGFIIADVPIDKSSITFFSAAGHWPVAVSVIFLMFYIFYTKKSVKSVESVIIQESKNAE